MTDPKRIGASRRKPRPAKCVREKLTDRILAWMNQPENRGHHFARDVAKAMGCSVGSATQGLHYMFCHGLVSVLRPERSPNVYAVSSKGVNP